MTHPFTCRLLTREDAEPYAELRCKGAIDFPLGFLITAEEAAATTGADESDAGAGHDVRRLS